MRKFLYETWLTEITDDSIENRSPQPIDSVEITAESFDDAVKKIRNNNFENSNKVD